MSDDDLLLFSVEEKMCLKDIQDVSAALSIVYYKYSLAENRLSTL